MAATSLAKDYDLPWVEKYRPHRVADIVGNQDVVARLQVIAQGGNMPNLIFSVSESSLCVVPLKVEGFSCMLKQNAIVSATGLRR